MTRRGDYTDKAYSALHSPLRRFEEIRIVSSKLYGQGVFECMPVVVEYVRPTMDQ